LKPGNQNASSPTPKTQPVLPKRSSSANIRGTAPIRRGGRRLRVSSGERNPAKMKWSPTQRPTILKVGTPCWQRLLAQHRRLLEPSGDKPTVAFRPRGLLRASQGGLRTRGGRLQLYGSTWRRARSWSATASVQASQGGVGVGSLCPIQRHE
jgi:hypothetical protein